MLGMKTQRSIMKSQRPILCAALISSSALFALGHQPPADAVKEELRQLQGTWTITSAEMSGNKVTAEKAGLLAIEIKDTVMTVVSADGKGPKPFTIKIDPSKKPKAMDWLNVQPGAPPLPTIYSIQGDELKICFPLLPKKGSNPPTPVNIVRPENFETKGRPIGLFVATRKKA